MSEQAVLYEVTDHVATVTINRPDKMNALSTEVMSGLVEAMKRARDDEDARVVVLTGAGEKAFCAGGDLKAFSSDEPLVHKHVMNGYFAEYFSLMPKLGKPSICAANGHTLAGGLGVAISCDLVIGVEGSWYGTPEINIGAFPYMIMAVIYRNIGRKKTNELLLLGDRITAEEACEIGLINKVVSREEFDGAVAEWAGRLAAKSPLLMKLGKDAMARQDDMPLEDALHFLQSQLTITFSTEDLIEGTTAFFEKREPEWKGR